MASTRFAPGALLQHVAPFIGILRVFTGVVYEPGLLTRSHSGKRYLKLKVLLDEPAGVWVLVEGADLVVSDGADCEQGDTVRVTGELHVEQWTDWTGYQRKRVKVRATQIERFPGGRRLSAR